MFKNATLDDDTAMVLEEAKVEGYKELGLAHIIFHRANQNKYFVLQ